MAGSSIGRTSDFHSGKGGSIPPPATFKFVETGLNPALPERVCVVVPAGELRHSFPIP